MTGLRVCAHLRVFAVVSTGGPVNTPRVSDISLVYCPGSRSGVPWLVYLAFRYRMKPATLSHKHVCVPTVGACSISFVKAINSHAKTCSHDDTTLVHIEGINPPPPHPTSLAFPQTHVQEAAFASHQVSS